MPKLAAPLDASGLKIANLGTPTASTDAATKAYVDANAGGGGGGGTVSFPPSLLQYANLSAQPTWATSNSASIYLAELPPSTSIMVGVLYIQTGNGLSVTTPTGWTLYATLTDSTHSRAFYIYVKAATGTTNDLNITWDTITNNGTTGNAFSGVLLELDAADVTLYGGAIRATNGSLSDAYTPRLSGTAGSLAVALVHNYAGGVIGGWRTGATPSSGSATGFAVMLADVFSARQMRFNLFSTTSTTLAIFGIPHA
jgi:hypothetical protein